MRWSTWCKATLRPRRTAAGAVSSSARSFHRRRIQNRCCTAISRSRALRPRAGTSRAVRYSWRPGWGAGSAVCRAAMTKWFSGQWCGTTPISTIRWASFRAASRSIFRLARTPTYTAPVSSRGSRTPIHRRRSSPGSGATRAANATITTSFSGYSGFRSSRLGRTGSCSSASSSGAISKKFASIRSRRIAAWPRARSVLSRVCITTRRVGSSMAPFATRVWSSTSAP